MLTSSAGIFIMDKDPKCLAISLVENCMARVVWLCEGRYRITEVKIAHVFFVFQELLRLWIRLQYQEDQDQDRFISSLWAVAKVSHSTEQLLFIIDAVREQVLTLVTLHFLLNFSRFNTPSPPTPHPPHPPHPPPTLTPVRSLFSRKNRRRGGRIHETKETNSDQTTNIQERTRRHQ